MLDICRGTTIMWDEVSTQFRIQHIMQQGWCIFNFVKGFLLLYLKKKLAILWQIWFENGITVRLLLVQDRSDID